VGQTPSAHAAAHEFLAGGCIAELIREGTRLCCGMSFSAAVEAFAHKKPLKKLQSSRGRVLLMSGRIASSLAGERVALDRLCAGWKGASSTVEGLTVIAARRIVEHLRGARGEARRLHADFGPGAIL
jgi:hypothetical protein